MSVFLPCISYIHKKNLYYNKVQNEELCDVFGPQHEYSGRDFVLPTSC